MSPVIPRPVGPTTDWNGSATTTASLPRNRTHVRPYQVIPSPPILTQRPAPAQLSALAPTRTRSTQPATYKKDRSACPIGTPGRGREGWNLCGFVRCIRYGALIQGREAQAIKKAISRAGTIGSARRPVRQSGHVHPVDPLADRPRARRSSSLLPRPCSSSPPAARRVDRQPVGLGRDARRPAPVAALDGRTVDRRPPRRRRAPAPADRCHLRRRRAAGLGASAACKPSRPVARQFIDGTELRTMLTKQFDEDTPPAYLAAQRAAVQGARPHPGRRRACAT